MLTVSEVKRLHVELTTRCNARCPMCMRNYRGYDYNSGYPICELSLQDFKHIVSPALCQQLLHSDTKAHAYEFRGVIFNGNLGDFASAKDGVEIVRYLVSQNVQVSINTNGSVRNPEWWQQLAMPGVSIGFALDGLEDTHHLYRQDTDWHKIVTNAKAFIAAGGRAIWRFVPFDHNRHQEAECKQLSQQLGFARFENIFDGRASTPVFTRNGRFSHQIGSNDSFSDTVPRLEPLLQSHVTWYNAKTVSHPKDVAGLQFQCIHKRNKEIYIAADGSIYPCCFLGFYPHTMHHPGNQELSQLVKENNALQYSLEHCLRWFDTIEQAWQHNSIAQGRPYQCVSSCGKI